MTTATVNSIHGGDLHQASREFGFPLDQWMDLSTGIAPWAWPIADIPSHIWHRLPAEQCPLERAAADFYGCDNAAILALPGSQFAIRSLPYLYNLCRVALPDRGYIEHEKAWREAGQCGVHYHDTALNHLDREVRTGNVDIVLVVNPNNPTTAVLDRERLLEWADILKQRGGCLIVDEAFMDVDETMSLSRSCPRPGLIVLRSLGKFFGLAGLRVGFLLSDEKVKFWLKKRMGPWAVSGPAQFLGVLALQDAQWHRQQRERIKEVAIMQHSLISSVLEGLNKPEEMRVAKGPLFISVFIASDKAATIFRGLARRGIWLRRFDYPDSQQGCLRFGLVKNIDQRRRLQLGLEDIVGEWL
jgi:cobalamin biosynthetic protein CobC